MVSVVSIIFNDSSSKFNKDLIRFLNRNLEAAILKGGLSFAFKIANKQTINDLRDRGIKRLPAMITDSGTFVGVPEIQEEILNRIKNNKNALQPKTDDEILNDYQLSAINEDVIRDQEGKLSVRPDDDGSVDLKKRAQEELERRGGLDRKPQPRQPDRRALRDSALDDNLPIRAPQAPERRDNLTDDMTDVYKSFERIKQTSASSDSRKDDEMMASLLERLG